MKFYCYILGIFLTLILGNCESPTEVRRTIEECRKEFGVTEGCISISQKWTFTILASAGLCIQTLFSVIMSITIIEMVMPIHGFQTEEDTVSCTSRNNVTVTNKLLFIPRTGDDTAMIERYPWDEYTQGIILSSFSWSSTFAEFFSGPLAERFGGKFILGSAILAQSTLTFMTPFAVYWSGSTALIISRVLIGLASDGLVPVCSTMIPHWTTPSDRTQVGNVIYTGPDLGLFFGTILPALIMRYSGIGWPAVFYFFGILGISWCLLWFSFVHENPESQPLVSEKIRKLPPPPWKQILSCKEFWAFTIALTGNNCAYYVMLNGLPKYMGNVVGFPIESNGYFSSLPYVFMWLSSMMSAWICDIILEKKMMSLTNARKFLTSIALMGPATFLLLASYAECDKFTVVTMFVVGIALTGPDCASLLMNAMDLSPNYAGTIMSLGSGVAHSVAILAPYLLGVMVPNSTIAEWRFVFWMVMLFAGWSNVVYLVWFRAEFQPWDDPGFVRSEKDEKEVKLNLMS